MTQALIVKVAFHNLKRELETLLGAVDPAIQSSAQKALAYATDLENSASTFIGGVAEDSEPQSTGDSTNYKLYEFLYSLGLTQDQLLLVARNEALHELRQLRMLRIVYGYSLPQAQAALTKFEERLGRSI